MSTTRNYKGLRSVVMLLAISIFASACGGAVGTGSSAMPNSTPSPTSRDETTSSVTPSISATPNSTPSPTLAVLPHPHPTLASTQVQDRASLIDALKKGGATVSSGDAIQQPFLSVAGQTITVNGGAVQTFEYSDANAMVADASKIGPDGTINTTSIMWVAQPHFYKAGRLLVIYPGTDAKVLDALKATLGEPFAMGANTVGTPLMQP